MIGSLFLFFAPFISKLDVALWSVTFENLPLRSVKFPLSYLMMRIFLSVCRACLFPLPLLTFAYSTVRLLEALDSQMTLSRRSATPIAWSPEHTPRLDQFIWYCVDLVLNSFTERKAQHPKNLTSTTDVKSPSSPSSLMSKELLAMARVQCALHCASNLFTNLHLARFLFLVQNLKVPLATPYRLLNSPESPKRPIKNWLMERLKSMMMRITPASRLLLIRGGKMKRSRNTVYTRTYLRSRK